MLNNFHLINQQITKNIIPQIIKIQKLSTTISKFQIIMDKYLRPSQELFSRIQELPQKLKTALLILGENGWFFDPNMKPSKLWKIQKAFSTGDIEKTDEVLVLYFEERLDHIEESIFSLAPKREKIIRAAFSAHRAGIYELSIPVLLAQSDGLCKDIYNDHYFLKYRDGKPRTSTYVETFSPESIQAAFLEPLRISLPISYSFKQRENTENIHLLNRHQVLHGESTDYANKVNSYKCISLINYITQAFKNDNSAS